MEKIHKFVLAVVVISLLLSALFSPMISVVCGIGLWIFLYVAQGGLAEGNPYKRMNYTSSPNFIEVKDYRRKEDIELRDSGSYNVAVFFFGTGLIMIAIGVVWIWILGF